MESKGERMIKLVYVAGAYTADTACEVDTNIAKAREMGKLVARYGAYPVIPHSNTSHFEGCAPDTFWLPATLEVCKRCDAIVVLDGWETSQGTRGEIDLMQKLGKPVFFQDKPPEWSHGSLSSLKHWIEYESSKDWVGSDPVAINDAIILANEVARLTSDSNYIVKRGMHAFADINRMCLKFFAKHTKG